MALKLYSQSYVSYDNETGAIETAFVIVVAAAQKFKAESEMRKQLDLIGATEIDVSITRLKVPNFGAGGILNQAFIPNEGEGGGDVGTPPIADFVNDTPGVVTVGNFTSFSRILGIGGDADTASWKVGKDHDPLVEFSTSLTASGKYFPLSAGTYTVQLTLTNGNGTDTETKTAFFTASL